MECTSDGKSVLQPTEDKYEERDEKDTPRENMTDRGSNEGAKLHLHDTSANDEPLTMLKKLRPSAKIRAVKTFRCIIEVDKKQFVEYGDTKNNAKEKAASAAIKHILERNPPKEEYKEQDAISVSNISIYEKDKEDRKVEAHEISKNSNDEEEQTTQEKEKQDDKMPHGILKHGDDEEEEEQETEMKKQAKNKDDEEEQPAQEKEKQDVKMPYGILKHEDDEEEEQETEMKKQAKNEDDEEEQPAQEKEKQDVKMPYGILKHGDDVEEEEQETEMKKQGDSKDRKKKNTKKWEPHVCDLSALAEHFPKFEKGVLSLKEKISIAEFKRILIDNGVPLEKWTQVRDRTLKDYKSRNGKFVNKKLELYGHIRGMYRHKQQRDMLVKELEEQTILTGNTVCNEIFFVLKKISCKFPIQKLTKEEEVKVIECLRTFIQIPEGEKIMSQLSNLKDILQKKGQKSTLEIVLQSFKDVENHEHLADMYPFLSESCEVLNRKFYDHIRGDINVWPFFEAVLEVLTHFRGKMPRDPGEMKIVLPETNVAGLFLKVLKAEEGLDSNYVEISSPPGRTDNSSEDKCLQKLKDAYKEFDEQYEADYISAREHVLYNKSYLEKLDGIKQVIDGGDDAKDKYLAVVRLESYLHGLRQLSTEGETEIADIIFDKIRKLEHLFDITVKNKMLYIESHPNVSLISELLKGEEFCEQEEKRITRILKRKFPSEGSVNQPLLLHVLQKCWRTVLMGDHRLACLSNENEKTYTDTVHILKKIPSPISILLMFSDLDKEFTGMIETEEFHERISTQNWTKDVIKTVDERYQRYENGRKYIMYDCLYYDLQILHRNTDIVQTCGHQRINAILEVCKKFKKTSNVVVASIIYKLENSLQMGTTKIDPSSDTSSLWKSEAKYLKEKDINAGEILKDLQARSIIFIGPVGSGKSATINTLAKKVVSETGVYLTSKPLTERMKAYYDCRDFVLIDTPGIWNSWGKEDILEEAKRSDVVVLVLVLKRIHAEEENAIKMFLKYFKHDHHKSFVLFSNGKRASSDQLKKFICEMSDNDTIRGLHDAVGERFITFENNCNSEAEKNIEVEKFRNMAWQTMRKTSNS